MEWLKVVAPTVTVLTARVAVRSEHDPMRTVSGLPELSKLTRKQGTAFSQLGSDSVVLVQASTTTVPARTGRWARVALMVLLPVMVQLSPWTSCEE